MTVSFSSPLAFAAHLMAVQRDMNALGPAIVAKATQMVWEEARRVLGTEGYNWPALSPNTHKTQPGMLLETGEMRDSIEWQAHGLEGQVGSNNDKAVWHEFGTSRIPPRPFLAGAAAAMGPRSKNWPHAL
jgi:phage gpG-like protein